MKKTKIWEEIIQMIYIVIAQLGILFSVTETFYISYDKVEIYICVVILSIILYMLSKREHYGGIFLGGGIVLAESILFFRQKDGVFKEVKRIGKIIAVHMENYMSNGEIVNVYENQKFTAGLLCLLILVSGVIVLAIVRIKRSLGVLAISFITFFIPFMAGKEPDATTLVCVGVLLVTAGFSKRKGIEEKDRKTVIYLGIIIGIFSVMIGGMLFQPTIQKSVNYT